MLTVNKFYACILMHVNIFVLGIMKLVMTVTIVDSLVLIEDITDAIEALEDHVQSVNVASMNKIS